MERLAFGKPLIRSSIEDAFHALASKLFDPLTSALSAQLRLSSTATGSRCVRSASTQLHPPVGADVWRPWLRAARMDSAGDPAQKTWRKLQGVDSARGALYP